MAPPTDCFALLDLSGARAVWTSIYRQVVRRTSLPAAWMCVVPAPLTSRGECRTSDGSVCASFTGGNAP